MVKPLVRTTVTPNQLTALRLTFGLLASAACMVGEPVWTRVGAALFVIAFLLDRADGTLARLSDKKSAFGHRFDLISDTVSNAMIFVGIGIGLRDSELGWWMAVLGLIAGIAVGAILSLVLRAEIQKGEGAIELKPFLGFDADDAIIVVPIALWLGWALPLLYLAAFITPFFALFFAWKHRRFLPRAV
jgi:phosphatidylglycerophosphate synthase